MDYLLVNWIVLMRGQLHWGGGIKIKISVLNAFLIGHHADDMLKFNETFSTYYFANQASTSNSYSY